MPKTANINARIEPDLKREAEKVFQEIGLTASEAIKIFYHKVVSRKGIPFEIDIPKEIVSTPGVVGGKPRFAGTRIAVQHIVGYWKKGNTPQEISDALDSITLADVHAALDYYHAHKAEIDARMESGYQEYLKEWEAFQDSPEKKKLMEKAKAAGLR